MAINKICSSMEQALSGVKDGSTILVSGFGSVGIPNDLIHGLIDQGARDLTVVANNAGSGSEGLAGLMAAKRVRKIICSYPRTSDARVFEELYASGELELELTPQGTLSERIRAAGAGIGGFFTPTGAGTRLADGKEVREIDGRPHVYETPIKGDLALVQAQKADRWGNLTYSKSARNFGPVMAMAAENSVVQAKEIVELGELDPEVIVTPGIFVDHVVHINNNRVWDI